VLGCGHSCVCWWWVRIVGAVEVVGIYDVAMLLEVGEVFAGYTIVRVLGAGAMGTVYLAAHPRLPRQDALKVLPVELTPDPQFRARFLREADLAASLSHPHIVSIYDRGEHDGQFWISMGYVDGTDAARLLREQFAGGMAVGEVVPIITAVGSALDYAHHRGLLHRDVKPANILLTEPDGQPRRVFLADFGIARRIDDVSGLTAANVAVGTVAYTAPEQLKGGPVDGRADQYALACTAFHLLAGAPPFDDSNPAVVIAQHVSAPPPSLGAYRPELAGLDWVFAIAMAKDPSGRFGSCQEFAHHLVGFGVGSSQARDTELALHTQDTQPVLNVPAYALPPSPSPSPPSPPPPGSPFGKQPGRRRPRVLIGALVAVALLIVAGGVVAGVKLTRHHNSAATATATAAPPPAAAAPNAGPFTGVYRADFGPVTDLDGAPHPGAVPSAGVYGLRSVCGDNGCVATASQLSGAAFASTLVFDEVGGSWVAVAISSSPCHNATAEIWEVFTLRPRSDGTLTGEHTRTANNDCQEKRAVTFTRDGNVDVDSLPDPASLPRRVVSPAEAFHGHYHRTLTFTNGLSAHQGDSAVTTECLRTGDRCMSYFHTRLGDSPLVFGDGTWIWDDESVSKCPTGGTTHFRSGAQYPLPQPPQDPIALLTGHGHWEQTGSCAVDMDFDETFTRTSD
jgi:serine/threonine protein kinase